MEKHIVTIGIANMNTWNFKHPFFSNNQNKMKPINNLKKTFKAFLQWHMIIKSNRGFKTYGKNFFQGNECNEDKSNAKIKYIQQ